MKSKLNKITMLMRSAILITLFSGNTARAQYAGWSGRFQFNDSDIMRAVNNYRLNRAQPPTMVDQPALPPAQLPAVAIQPAPQLPQLPAAVNQPAQAVNGQGCVIQISVARGLAAPTASKIYKISDISQTDCVYINLKNSFPLDLAGFENRLRNYSGSILTKDSSHYTDPNDVPGISTAALVLIEQVRADFLASSPTVPTAVNAAYDLGVGGDTYLLIDAAYGGFEDVGCTVTYQASTTNYNNPIKVYGRSGYGQSAPTLMSTVVTVPEAACVMSSISNNNVSPDLLIRGNAGLQQLVINKAMTYANTSGYIQPQNFNITGINQNQNLTQAQAYQPATNYYNFSGYGF